MTLAVGANAAKISGRVLTALGTSNLSAFLATTTISVPRTSDRQLFAGRRSFSTGYVSKPDNPPLRCSSLVRCSICKSSTVHQALLQSRFTSSDAATPSSASVAQGEASLEVRKGVHVLTLPLPGRLGEKCKFFLKPESQTIADLCENIRREDNGVSSLAVYSTTSSSPLDYSQAQLEDVKALVAHLHAILNAKEHCLRSEQELQAKLESVRKDLEPMEKVRQSVALEAEKRTSRLSYLGLALMGVQIGAFARLTWWEYSWDIMEPVTYFATYTAVIAGYMYYVVTRLQYEYTDAKDRIMLNKFYKLSRKRGFDIHQYNRGKEQIAILEKELVRIRQSSPYFASRSMPDGDHAFIINRKASAVDGAGKAASTGEAEKSSP